MPVFSLHKGRLSVTEATVQGADKVRHKPPAAGPITEELATKVALLETELDGMRAMVAELRQSRDHWQARYRRVGWTLKWRARHDRSRQASA